MHQQHSLSAPHELLDSVQQVDRRPSEEAAIVCGEVETDRRGRGGDVREVRKEVGGVGVG